MQDWIVYSIGFAAQIVFSGRMLVQWLLSEKGQRVFTPRIFWQLSLLASVIMFVYGWLRDDFAIILGQAITYFIYIRNLQLQGQWVKFHPGFRLFLWIFPVLIVIYGYNNNAYDLAEFFKNEAIPFWLLLLGIAAQIIFTARFVYQWWYSEKTKVSSLPAGFWILSLTGSVMTLIYAVFREDPVLLVSNGFGSIIYIRNLMLLHK